MKSVHNVLCKVRKKAKIRNRYNQVPHLTPYVKVTKTQETLNYLINDTNHFNLVPQRDAF